LQGSVAVDSLDFALRVQLDIEAVRPQVLDHGLARADEAGAARRGDLLDSDSGVGG